jgi:hypothetical protein
MNNIQKSKRLNSSSMQIKWFSLYVCAGLLSACATPYQPMSTLGGYREIQLASNTYRVMFFGNGYTNAELAVEYALRRCAELIREHGFRELQSDDIHYPSADDTIQFPAPGDYHANGQ